MAGLGIELRDEDVGQALGRLQRLLGAVVDKTPLMARLAAYLEISTRERFETGSGPDGKRWKPSIRAQLHGGQTLVDKGLLRDSFHGFHTADTAGVGTADLRAAIHHLGGIIRAVKAKALFFQIPGVGARLAKKVNIPARPIVGVSGEDREEVHALIADYIAEAAS